MSKRDEQIARIQGLMTYGISSAPKKTPITESIEGPDGKVYAIIREGSKFYIKSAAKGSELVAESFDYIGGFMNKKSNEFSSYNQASKNLELKVRSLNEAYGVNKPVELLNPEKKETLMVEMTDAMKASLARYRQIMNNAAGIMNESATISASNTGVPEAPKTTGFSPKLGEPFNNAAQATLDKDLKATANDPAKQSEPFGEKEKEKAEENKDAQYVPKGSVANQHPSGGKVVRVNESDMYEETIEECDEWGSCGVPENGGVGEVGDDDPFTEIVSEDAPVGFADDDTAFTEGEDAEDVDIDLDDIDSSLEDEDGMEDTEIDDIDSEDVAEEPEMEDEVEGETDDIEALRQEIAELRSLVNELMGNEAEVEDEEGVEGEEDFADDSDAEFEGGYEDDDFEGDDFEDEDEPDFMKESVNLPFPVKVRYDELQDVRSRYGLAKVLKKMMAEMGGNENDAKAISMIHGKLMEILQCDYELRACMKNNHLEDDDWYEIIATMEANTTKIARLVNSLSFLDDAGRKLVDGRVGKLQSYVAKYSEYYDTKINPDAQVEPEPEEEEIEEIPDVDPDEEVDVTPSEEEMHKKAEKAALRNGGRTGIDDIDDSFGGLNMDDMYPESVRPRKLHENGTKLNVFGKHPGYRKNLMSLPKTGNDDEGNVRDWNDDSVYSEEPFGSKIGSSAPYEDVINASVEAIMESLKKKR